MNTPEDRHASRRAGPPSRLAFVVCCALGAGCGDDGGGGGSGGTDTDSGGACVEDPVNLQLQSNPDFTGVIGGDKIGNYTKVAVGYVDEPANASGCCQDYAMATASTSKVRIRFGIQPTGLSFQEDGAEIVTLPNNAEDLLLLDVDGDNRNDLLALTPGWVRVFLGESSSPYLSGSTMSSYKTNILGHVGGKQLIAAELDCSAGLELAMPAPSDKVVVLDINGNGSLSPAFVIPLSVGTDPQSIAVGDLEGDGDMDMFVAHGDGGFSVMKNNCGGGWSLPDEHDVLWITDDTASSSSPGLQIAVGPFCPGQPSGLAVVLGYSYKVGVKCADGSGDFVVGEEPHGSSDPTQGFLDYGWRLSPIDVDDDPPHPVVVGLALEDGELFALREGSTSDTRRVWRLDPGACSFLGRSVPLAELGSGGTIRDLAVYRVDPDDTTWSGFAFAGAPGLGLVH